MLEKLKGNFENQYFQYILTDNNGVVLESDNKLMMISPGVKLADIHPFFEALPDAVNKEGEEVEYNCVHLDFEEKEIIADLRIIPTNDVLLIVLMDLTSHYTNYQAITQARNESVIARELIVIKNRELEERERFKNQFIRNFSHELRNPLTSIIAMTNVLGSTKLNNDQEKMIEFIADSNTNLQLMLEDVLSLSMIAAGKMEIREALFNFPRMIELLKFTYHTRANTRGIKFESTIDPKIPEELEGDRLRLFQVITNLLDNAIRYTDSGKVELRVKLNQKWANTANLRFEVVDTGKGIPESRQEEIFESFKQVNPQESKGSGLGLSIVRSLLELMGSEIKVESEEGKGSRFYFDLSLKFPLGLKTEEKKSTAKPITKVNKPDRKIKVLIVEDDAGVQTALFKTLMDTGMFFVDLVNDGGLVIQELMNNTYDLVLMDVDLPNTSGDQITRIVRDLPFSNVKSIPIVGLTANAFEDTIQMYKDSGMQAVLTKPFDENELLNTLLAQIKA